MAFALTRTLALSIKVSVVLWGSFALSSALAIEPKKCRELLSQFASQVPPELTRRLSGLNRGAKIPTELYSKYDSRVLGEAIVQWAHALEAKSGVLDRPGTEINFARDTQIFLHFQPEDAKSILDNHYMNQHQYGDSGGHLHQAMRRNAEDRFTGLKMGRVEDVRLATSKETMLELRPKSAMLHVSMNKHLGYFLHLLDEEFGSVIAVMKQEVKRRSLWVYGDSLRIGRWIGEENLERFHQYRGTFERGMFPKDVKDMADTTIEALIFGRITIEDVDHFLVVNQTEAINPETISTLKAYGKPIFSVEPIEKQNRLVYEYEELLSRGENLPFALPPAEHQKFKTHFDFKGAKSR